MDADSMGARIARARRRRGLSQQVVAGLIGRSESWLSQVERGLRKADSHSVLIRLAEVLRVDVDELAQGDRGTEGRVYRAASLIEQAMMQRGIYAQAAEPSTTRHLCEMARAAYRDYQSTRYDSVGAILPRLIHDAECAGGGRAACLMRSLVYDTAAALLNRVGESSLAWMAADRAMSAATQSGDPVAVAVSAWRMSYVITSRKHPEHGLELAMLAIDTLGRAKGSLSGERLSVYGALHLAAATAAASAYDQATATHLLARASEAAVVTGDMNHRGTAFGPANVSLHAMSVALRFGDARVAAQRGEALDPSVLPDGCAGRRTQLHLDLARAYSMRKQDAAAVNLLLSAEKISPQLVRYDQRTREVLTSLIKREHRPSTPELRPLARRAGVI